MSRWYQNVLTAEVVEVTTLEEDDYYVANASNWSRIERPPCASPVGQVKAPTISAAKKKHGG